MTIDPETDASSSAPSRRLSLGRIRRGLWVVAGLSLLVLFAALFMTPREETNPQMSLASAFGGSFTMTDQNGRIVTDQTLRGKPYAIFFGFTRCPDVCPTTLNRLAQLRKALGEDGMKFNIVFVSVDPEHDTREGIGDYLTLFDTPIIGLTGTDEQIAKIVKAFHVYYAKVPMDGGDYTIDHTASIFLMDRNGDFVTSIDHHEGEPTAIQKLKRAIKAE